MIRSSASKVMWVGRTTAALIGLAVALAVVLGVATTALAALPGDPFRLGQTNGIDAMSTLVGNVAGPMLTLDNSSTGAGATALDLRVEAGMPPMKVNSGAKVANLNADSLDGKDSMALGVTIKTIHERVFECASTEGFWNECARARVNVPAGKRYRVTVLSSFAAQNISETDGNAVSYCPAIRGGSFPVQTCISSAPGAIKIAPDLTSAAAMSGEVGPLPAGSYTFSTVINPTLELGAPLRSRGSNSS
jgi:hypothetical protein